MMYIDSIACILSIVGAHLVSGDNNRHRRIGFFIWLCSNTMWVMYGITNGYSVAFVLQYSYFIYQTIRGIINNKKENL